MKMIEDRTRIGTRNCITFKKQTTEDNFLKIKNEVGCHSWIGKLKDKKSQTLSLDLRIDIKSGLSCMNQATIAHELVHALGFDHEHNRPDRDDWVQIDFNNVRENRENSDFKILDSKKFYNLSTPYDYKSIMHYHSFAHAINESLPTIRAIKAPFEIEINENLSNIDVEEIRTLYNCKQGILIRINFINC